MPSTAGLAWDARNSPSQPFALAMAGQQAVEVDFEVPTAQRTTELRRSGVQLPRVSGELADPRAHRDFVDGRVTAVGFGITAGGFLLYCEGLPLPVLVPESQVDLGLTEAVPLSATLYPDRDAALAALGATTSRSGYATYAWYRGAGGALVVPTLFSPATTPRIARTMGAVRQSLGETGQRELKVLLLTLSGSKVLQKVLSRVVRVPGPEPASPPSAGVQSLGSTIAAPRQPVPPRPSVSAPAPAPASGTPAPVPGAPAPSPGLVRALTGSNPTPPSVGGSRLPQDVAVNPRVPRVLPSDRSISSSPSQNAQLQADIEYLKTLRATNIRVNQQQVSLRNGQRVGTNRPDLQFDYNGRRYHVEYDSPSSGRGRGHQLRTTSNDPSAEVILLVVP